MKVWALLATGSPDWVQVTAITTGMLALATFVLAGLTWVGVRENKQLIGFESIRFWRIISGSGEKYRGNLSVFAARL